jgi:hypothetical protein
MMLRTIVVLVGILVGISVANAIQIPPECKGLRDQIGCACALQNGGFIRDDRGGGRHWWSKHNKPDRLTKGSLIATSGNAE